MASYPKTAIIIAGPTAVGKTSVAIDVAKYFRTEVISADSRQCYRELNIGVARPSPEELEQVPHHFIASHSIQQKITAADFEKFALQKADEVFEKQDALVMTGGTGLYIKAFTDGLDPIPDVPPQVRSEIQALYQKIGIIGLQKTVSSEDPAFFEEAEIQNPQRLMRALEVVRHTGRSILDFRTSKKLQRSFNVLKIALELPKDILHQRINTRVDQMVERGLVEEVKSLQAFRHLNALQTVGYKEIFQYLDGERTLAEAIEDIKRNTRQYAKRQMTWFRKDPEFTWLPPSTPQVLESINPSLHS